jgi:predicted transcriptional regulator
MSEGKDAADEVTRILEERAEFLVGVDRGIAAADGGEVIEHDEVVGRIERLLQS